MDMLEFGDQLAALVAGIELQIDLAHPLAPRLALGAQLVETLDTEYRPRAPRLDALANPHFFFLEQLVGTGIGQPLFMQQLLLALLILAVAAGKIHQLAAVEFDDARAHAVEEGAVVGDEEQRDAGLDQQGLQPFDGGDVEVVGRLVEQQHFRRNGQRLGQRQPFLLAAGKRPDAGVGVEAKAIDDFFRLRFVGPRAAGLEIVLQGFHTRQQGVVIARAFGHPVRHVMVGGKQRRGFAHAGNHRLEHGCCAIERRLLRHIADADARLHPDLPVIEPSLAGTGSQRRQQRGLAGAVAADQRYPLAWIKQEISVIEERHMAIGKTGGGEFEIWHVGGIRRPAGGVLAGWRPRVESNH